jgi:hypothetical protein
MRVLVVGINPQYPQYRYKKGCTRYRFHKWLDFLGLRYVAFTNCISTPGLYKNNMIDYDRLEKSTRSHKKIFALGNFPSKALDKLNIEHFKLPHPSPLNRKLNSKSYEKRILQQAKKYLTKQI